MDAKGPALSIGEAARQTGVPAKTIRYYEQIGLLPTARRAENGYRHYGPNEISILRFVQRARSLGFPIKDVAELLTLWGDRNRASADVKRLARTRIAEIEQRIAELEEIRDTLRDLSERCHGDLRPECPILAGIAGAKQPARRMR